MRLRRFVLAVAVPISLLSSVTTATGQTAPTPGALPQEPPPDLVTLLKSSDPRQQAWGAWYVGVGQLRELAPMVADIVRQQVRVPDRSWPALYVALDALIQLRVPLDAELLPELYAIRPPQALILASFTDKDGDAFLRGVLLSSTGHEWFAAANQLLARHASTLGSDLLASVHLKLTVNLVDEGHGVGSGGSGSVGVGCGAGGLTPGMPPFAAYELTSFAHAGVTVLATGPKPIYYRRVVAPAGHSPAASVTAISGPTGDDRLLYVAALAGIEPSRLPLRGDEQKSVTIKDDSSLDTVVARLREDLSERYQRLVAMLVAQNVLSPDAVIPQPQIDVEIADYRRSVSR